MAERLNQQRNARDNRMRVDLLSRSLLRQVHLDHESITSKYYVDERKHGVWEFRIAKNDSSQNLVTLSDPNLDNPYCVVRWDLRNSKLEIPAGPQLIVDMKGNKKLSLAWKVVDDPSEIADYLKPVIHNHGVLVQSIQKNAA